MPRDLTGMGRHPPQPRYQPFAFYSAVRLGDPEMLARIMQVDPYFITQDNGGGAPLHFAVTYRNLDMVHHLLNNGAAVNQRDTQQGWTPLHRAAHLAHLDGYIEIYEYLLSRGADPSVLTDDYDPYLNPGPKTAVEVATDDPATRERLAELNARYASVPKAPVPHKDIGDWWALYDYGPEVVASWPATYSPAYPEAIKRRRDKQRRKAERAQRGERLAAAYAALSASGYTKPFTLAMAEVTVGPAASGAKAAGSGDSASVVASTDAAASSTPLLALPSLAGGTAFLFPGQGSQAVGMVGTAAAELPAVRAMLETAQRVLGYDLLQILLQGPQARLDDTVYAQPALLVADLAAAEVLRARDPSKVAACSAAAGLSLGEYAALVWAGAISFENALKVVKVRAESMAAAASTGGRPHGMLSVVGLDDGSLEAACKEAEAAMGPGTVCLVANRLFPTGRVVSGHVDALEAVQAKALELGALKATRLAVSGAFHTPLMAPACAALEAALTSVPLSPPRFPVLSNVTAAPFPSDPAAIRALLARQLVEPVQWEGTLQALVGAGVGLAELGPGTQIRAMVRRVDAAVWKGMECLSASD